MTTTVNQYQIYCETEEEYVSAWDTAPLTSCPHNNTHVVDLNSVVIIGAVNEAAVKIDQEDIPTQGYYRLYGFQFTAATGPNIDTSYDVTFPYPVNILTVTLEAGDENIGDIVNAVVGPGTVIGVITADVSIGDTIINVSSTVLSIIKMGFQATLSDGTQTDALGEVTNIDLINNQITVASAATLSFSASSPTYVQMTVLRVTNYYIHNTNATPWGNGSYGGSYLPANVIGRVIYTNMSDQPKIVSINIEMFY